MAVTCTPSETLKTTKCLKCLSKSQLAMVIMLTLASATRYSLPGDLHKLMEDSVCFTCMSDKQLLQAVVAVIADQYLTGYTMDQIRDMASCAQCANPKQVKAAISYLICKLYSDAEQ